MGECEVVADATVLIFLGKLQRLDLLHDTFETVCIPTEVHESVVTQGKEIGAADAVQVDRAIDRGWIEVQEIDALEEIERYGLETGETAVLSLAIARDHDEVLADEESVREVARLSDLKPRGTLWFLFTALRNDELSFGEFIESLERLLDEGFYLDEAVYLGAVQEARSLATDGG